MLNTVSSSIFTDSVSVGMTTVVSAEWNQNLFNHPYLTVAGTGTKMSLSAPTGTVSSVTEGAKSNFTTKSFAMSGGSGKVSYTVTTNSGKAYKIITYVRTDNPEPVMITAYADGSVSQYGSSSEQASIIGWTKVTTYIGAASDAETISSFVYTINANDMSGSDTSAVVRFTVPEVYETTYFDYRNHSLWPTDSPFTNFRPGESYVYSGSLNCELPTDYRKINTTIINDYTKTTKSLLSSVIQNPSFMVAPSPVPMIKNILPSTISQYKYFVSDASSKSITAIYEKPIMTNKIVIKLNTVMTTPTINVLIDGTAIVVDGSASITVPTSPDGLLTLYWTGSAWTKTKWSDMPKFSSAGELAKKTTLSKITVTQVSKTNKTEFNSYTSSSVTEDLDRMHVIEISPRLEIDLSDFVQTINISKTLDSKSTNIPVSSTNSNTAQINLSGIPALNGNNIVPIFSSQSDSTLTILSSMLRKGIKFYVGFELNNYSMLPGTNINNVNTYIPGGVFYSDTWDESDIDSVSVQCFDISRYLQAIPAPDYVANLKTVFEIVTNILEMAGFTDYDYDSLYKVCNNKAAPLDIFYYYNNSKDTTLIDAINKIFLPYQIAAYIDEYGVMKFKGLHDMLTSVSSSISISEDTISKGGLSISNKAKPGKISIRYQPPKIKQSPALQNLVDKSVSSSSSYVYTTQADVVWQQQSTDSVGFNYLDADMLKDANVYKTNINDIKNIFHSWSLSSSGYAAIEDEVVSFLYKEYKLSKGNSPTSLGTYASLQELQTAHPLGSVGDAYTVSGNVYYWDSATAAWKLFESKEKIISVKNDLELQSEVNKYIKQNGSGLKISVGAITDAVANGETITYTCSNSFSVNDKVSISGIDPAYFNVSGIITARDANHFVVSSTNDGDDYVSGGVVTASLGIDIKQEPTGNITNVERGLFGTPIRNHKLFTNLASKNLSATILDVGGDASSKVSLVNDHDTYPLMPSISKIKLTRTDNENILIYPTEEIDEGYHTYSVKFDIPYYNKARAGVFFNMNDFPNGTGAYFVELVRYTPEANKPKYLVQIIRNGYTLFFADITAEYNLIVDNFPKIAEKTVNNPDSKYVYFSDKPLSLKVVHYLSDGSDGENATTSNNKSIISVFLNNFEIQNWQQPGTPYDADTNSLGSGWKNTALNTLTGRMQKPCVDIIDATGTKFGYYSSYGVGFPQDHYPEFTSIVNISGTTNVSNLREIYATKKPLKERSISYFFQDREFLDGIVQDQPLHSLSPSYMMQTNPEISGINVYDVQYTTPAAVSVDVWPINYMWTYIPGAAVEADDRSYYQKKLIDEYSLAYSTVINTGYRAKFAIANNSSNLVFLHAEATDTNKFAIELDLYTDKIIAPADQEIVEYIVDPSNIAEVVQMDAEWIQSKEAAYRTMRLIELGLEGFSKDISLNIFGNPLIQVGDVVTLSYSLNGISNQKCIVHSVSHSFENGLTTSLVLNRIQE